jgi:hypothetical protein
MAMESRNVRPLTSAPEPDRMETSGTFGNLKDITNFTVEGLTETENTLNQYYFGTICYNPFIASTNWARNQIEIKNRPVQ